MKRYSLLYQRIALGRKKRKIKNPDPLTKLAMRINSLSLNENFIQMRNDFYRHRNAIIEWFGGNS